MSEPSIDEYQRAFLLLQVLGHEEGRIPRGEANKALSKAGNNRLGLAKTNDANRVRTSLVPEFLSERKVRSAKGGNPVVYELTDAGRHELLRLRQYPGLLQVNGLAITRLLEISRIINDSAPTDPNEAQCPAGEAQLGELVLQELRDLARGEYGARSLIPIHALRARVCERESSVSRAEVDNSLWGLKRAGRISFVALDKRGDATEEQVSASLSDLGQILFFIRNEGL